MKIFDYFKKVSSMSVEETRQFIKERKPNEFNLLDVRQPREYEKGHIPGAALIPVSQIDGQIHAIDPKKPTIVY